MRVAAGAIARLIIPEVTVAARVVEIGASDPKGEALGIVRPEIHADFAGRTDVEFHHVVGAIVDAADPALPDHGEADPAGMGADEFR